ncbi:rRNA binding protein [Hysterangium stoloniferum]|nr:rRNA binding protein [Hysterangium stoloniferum]
MAKRRKNRTHLKGASTGQLAGSSGNAPKSFIIKHGQVGSSISQLVKDMRKVMEPNTATRLKERSRNRLKDYLTLAPALNVSHLLAFTLTPISPSLRLVRLPAGPTLSFRVERYSLIKDILKASRHPRSIGAEYLSPPLLVLASFPQSSPTTPQQLPLLIKALQSLFPPLSPKTLSLPSARRVVLISYNESSGTLDFRHYVITVRPYGVPRRVRRVIEASAGNKKKSTLDLSNHQDVADFLLRKTISGYESASSAASSAGEEDSDNAVALPTDYVGRNNKKGERRAVRLDEIGPRMELKLIKIVEGVPGKEGSVIYHQFVTKSKTEVAKQREEHAAKERLRKQRREEQERNVKLKKQLAKENGEEYDENRDSNMDDDEPEENAADDGDDEGAWDDDEEISEGESEEEEDLAEQTSDNTESEVEQPPRIPPPKRRKR